eukprot:3091726-Rhodomonas_salina.2
MSFGKSTHDRPCETPRPASHKTPSLYSLLSCSSVSLLRGEGMRPMPPSEDGSLPGSVCGA